MALNRTIICLFSGDNSLAEADLTDTHQWEVNPTNKKTANSNPRDLVPPARCVIHDLILNILRKISNSFIMEVSRSGLGNVNES